MRSTALSTTITDLLVDYKQEHVGLIRENPAFARWLEEDYRPLAGGWQY